MFWRSLIAGILWSDLVTHSAVWKNRPGQEWEQRERSEAITVTQMEGDGDSDCSGVCVCVCVRVCARVRM